jgi:hypothetical protein
MSEENQNTETITMTKDEYSKAIQSAEDKLRTSYSKQIKELQAKIPHEKSDEEKDYEDRLSKLEAKEKRLNLIDSLTTKNIDKSFADYLKDDVDVEKFGTAIDNLVNAKLSESGFKPSGHSNNTEISKDKWQKMNYHEKQDFYEKNPELAKKMMGL